MNIDDWKHDDWITYFSGDKWSPLGFSSWVSLYTRRPFFKELDYFVNQTIMVWDGEAATCYLRESERECFGKKVAAKVIGDPAYVDFICDGFRAGTDLILSIYDKKQTDFTYEEYADYNFRFLTEYYPFHLQVKNVVDFLPKRLLDVYLSPLQAARVYAESVFSREIDFMRRIAGYIGKKAGCDPEHILHCFTDELTAYWREGRALPDNDVLEERRQGSVVFFANGGIQDVWVGKEISQFSSIFSSDAGSNIVTGQMAFKGQARGVARVIFDPANVKEFNDGDILVALWTRPEYLPLMKKAGAFVTDGGGILSHAAIVARELKKPCVIGTKIATKVFKDGDLVEVDADKGTVRKLRLNSLNS